MIRRVAPLCFFALSLLVLLPAAASAQSAFSGVVRDTSGAVLPGVSVEAASPVLIEKSRYCRHRFDGPLHDYRPPPGNLQAHLHARGLLHVRTRRRRAGGQHHRPDQR